MVFGAPMLQTIAFSLQTMLTMLQTMQTMLQTIGKAQGFKTCAHSQV